MHSEHRCAARGTRPHFEEALRHILDNPAAGAPRMVYQVATAYGLDELPPKTAIALEYFHTGRALR